MRDGNPHPTAGQPVLSDTLTGGVKGKDTPTLGAQHRGEAGAAGHGDAWTQPACSGSGSEHGWRPEAHLGIAASNLDDPVADGQQQFHDAVGVPILGLHQGLAQGQPHVAGQEVLTVLLRGPASPRRCPQQPAGRRCCPLTARLSPCLAQAGTFSAWRLALCPAHSRHFGQVS